MEEGDVSATASPPRRPPSRPAEQPGAPYAVPAIRRRPSVWFTRRRRPARPAPGPACRLAGA